MSELHIYAIYICYIYVRSADSLKYAAVASMPSNTKTVRTVSSTFFLFGALSFWVFGAVMGLLWRPGCGIPRVKEETSKHD